MLFGVCGQSNEKYILILMSGRNWEQLCEEWEGGEGWMGRREEARTFVFQREETQQSSIVETALNLLQPLIDLTALFQAHCPPEHHSISLYSPNVNRFVPLRGLSPHPQSPLLLPRELFEPSIIMVRFRGRTGKVRSEADSGTDSEGLNRKERSRERSIGEAIQLVKRWREAQAESGKPGQRRLSLAEAARTVGVSKKTLDDYYYQLRLGEFYCFDFAGNLAQKVGVLRAYVREFKPDRDQKDKNMRHPRSLRIIEEFTLPSRDDTPSAILPELPSESSLRSLSVEAAQRPFVREVMQSYEDRFFRNFQFLMDDPNDPFLQIERDFKKKSFDEANDFFFF